MKPIPLLIIAAAAAAAVVPAQAATNIGISVGINAPGQYGRIDINNYPQPRLEYAQPVIHLPSPFAVHQRPIYLYVPQPHRANWGRYCSAYGACGQPVYFVQETWVRDEYRREHGNREHDNGEHDKHHGRKKVKDHDRKDKGHGHGHGHGNRSD